MMRLRNSLCFFALVLETFSFMKRCSFQSGITYTSKNALSPLQLDYETKILATKCIESLMKKKNMTATELEKVWTKIITGELSNEQTAAILCLLRAKGETPAEISGCFHAMNKMCISVDADFPILDIVGTGGDGANTINISTASAVLASAAGARVCKFGNRSASSLCGSADVVEELGIPLHMTPFQIKRCVDEAGIAFMFAPLHFPLMKNVAPIRKLLKVRTSFNILGPLLNPAKADRVVIGVFDESIVSLIADSLCEIGHIEVGLVVYGCGLDEVSPLGPSRIIEIRNKAAKGEAKHYEKKDFLLEPKDYGIERCLLEDLKGGDRTKNAKEIREVLNGGKVVNAKKNSLILNAGLGLYVYGIAKDVTDGFHLARETLESGKAIKKLDEWIAVSSRLSIS